MGVDVDGFDARRAIRRIFFFNFRDSIRWVIRPPWSTTFDPPKMSFDRCRFYSNAPFYPQIDNQKRKVSANNILFFRKKHSTLSRNVSLKIKIELADFLVEKWPNLGDFEGFQ